jgi:hypothetical protein
LIFNPLPPVHRRILSGNKLSSCARRMIAAEAADLAV